jgi:3-oxoacyl-[acyl-carrier-protein] synthase II
MPSAARARTPPQIAGLGVVTSYGWGKDALLTGLLSQRSGVRPVELAGIDGAALVGRVPDGGTDTDAPSRFGKALFAAAREAVSDAEAAGWVPGRRVGLVMSTTLGEIELRRALYFGLGGKTRSRTYLSIIPSTSPSMLLAALGYTGGPVLNVQAACAGFNTALLLGKMFLDNDMADDVLVVGCDFPNTGEDVWHFAQMRALVTTGEPFDVCRPFQVGTRGFVTGEGAGAVVLTRQDTERSYGQLLGGAMNHDPYHPIGINPDYDPIFGVYQAALDDAGVAGGAVDYFNTHGAGTGQGDPVEIAVLNRFLPNARLFSIKPLTGHAHGAAGIIELSATLLAYHGGRLAVAPRVADVHPDLTRIGRAEDLLNGVSRYDGGVTVKGSMGMGGYNAVIVVRQPRTSGTI